MNERNISHGSHADHRVRRVLREAVGHAPAPFLRSLRDDLGERSTLINTTMENKTFKLEPSQREALVSMLRDAKHSASADLQKEHGISESAVIRELAEANGAKKHILQIEDLSTKIEELTQLSAKAEHELKELGFRWNDSRVLIDYAAPYKLQRTVDDILKKKREPIEKSLKKYDLAIAEVWTADTNQDARKIVEGLI